MLIGGDYISNDIMLLTLVCQCLSTFALVSASRWLAEIWQLSRRGATGELEAAFKFQSLVPRPVRAIRVTIGSLEPSPIARGLPRRIFSTSLTGDGASETAEDDWERGCKFHRRSCKLSFLFPHCRQSAPRTGCSQATKNYIREVDSYRPCVTWA